MIINIFSYSSFINFRRFFSAFLIITFTATSIPSAYAQTAMLPILSTEQNQPLPHALPLLKGIKVRVNDPFHLEFLLDRQTSTKSDTSASQRPVMNAEAARLVKYFLVSLTVPEQDLWVNLSPYEKDRIIPDSFSQTEMGRDLLGLDYLLKKTTAMLLHPDGEVGKQFWSKLYAQTYAQYGTTAIPIDTFNKVWITTDKAEIYEKSKDTGTPLQSSVAFVTESHLKVMLETDYLALRQNTDTNPSLVPANDGVNIPASDEQAMAREIIRDIVIPVLEKEVNEGAYFSQLKQMYNSLVLATWYKKKLTHALLTTVYADQKKLEGITHDDPGMQEQIWSAYTETFRKGIVNLIKEEPDPATGETMPHKYFSGGAVLHGTYENTQEISEALSGDDYAEITVDLAQNDTEKTVVLMDVVHDFTDITRGKFKLFGQGRIPTEVNDFLWALNDPIEKNNTKKFVQIMQKIMKIVIPDIAYRFRSFMRENIGNQFNLNQVINVPTLLSWFPQSENKDLLELAIDPDFTEPKVIQELLINRIQEKSFPKDQLESAKDMIMLLRSLYEPPETLIPLQYLIEFSSKELFSLFERDSTKTISGPDSIEKAIKENNSLELIQLIRNSPALDAKKIRILTSMRKILANYGYSLPNDINITKTNDPETPLTINSQVLVNLSIKKIEGILNDTQSTRKNILNQVFSSLDVIEKELIDSDADPQIFNSIIQQVYALPGFMTAKHGYLSELAVETKNDELKLSLAVTEPTSSKLLGLDAGDIEILKAFQSMKKHNTHPTLHRISQHLSEQDSLLESHLKKLQEFFKGRINLNILDSYTAYDQETAILSAYIQKNNISSYNTKLLNAMMEESGADEGTVIFYLKNKSIFLNNDNEPLKIYNYPVFVNVDSKKIAADLPTRFTAVQHAIETFLNGSGDTFQSNPIVHRLKITIKGAGSYH
ncbi:MAG: hypothetical protein WCI27_08880, partial [Candidatus Omnitrophota bacterium]